ncbi:hypothetical protein HYH03_006482 [Edaphochlamys debaryana]|uniref:Histone-lysine N-methyltransferase, H3 lysine-79 specific n=1 Tax=Edaphochlamys debaryana TaxID=47281 RepID=A0A835Y5J2_9CHLO|nr:hypothetical protein HYH03_006482 [Edaphochlamys debaryana]|eukprot:KAG2495539.1 hypothetical protein HYH03_006482 [Edaphochlamys debaryana]
MRVQALFGASYGQTLEGGSLCRLRPQRVPSRLSRQPPSATHGASTTAPVRPAPEPSTLTAPLKLAGRQGVFFSRQECLELLGRVADACAEPHRRAELASPDDAALVSEVFDAVYDELEEVFFSKRGYSIPAKEVALVDATGGSATYGEITGEGVQQFLAAVPLQPDDVLVDLGSGIGRLTLQAAATVRIERSVGIELSATRHEQACWVAERLAEVGGLASSEEETELEASAASPRAGGGPGSANGGGAGHESAAGGNSLLLTPVELRQEDLMTADLRDGTAFFLCSTAFPGAACRAIAERLAAHPRFRMLITSRALPLPSPLKLMTQFPCSFSWTARGVAYVYVRSLQEAPTPLLASVLAEGSFSGAAGGASSGGSGEDGAIGIPSAAGIACLPSTSTMTVVRADRIP